MSRLIAAEVARAALTENPTIIPLGVADRLWKRHIVKSAGEQRCSRFEAHRLVRRGMVLDVIAREITHRFERALRPSPASRSSSFHPLSTRSLSSPLSSPEVHRYFTRSFPRCRPFAETRNAILPPPPFPGVYVPLAGGLDPFVSTPRGGVKPPCGIEGSQLSYPICPYFS